MRRKDDAGTSPWTIDAYATVQGAKPVWAFIQGLEGSDRVEAFALVKLLEEKGNLLRRPHSGALGNGLFELRGKQVRLFYAFLPARVIVLLDGEVKKRDDIPARTLERMRILQAEVLRRPPRQGGRGKRR